MNIRLNCLNQRNSTIWVIICLTGLIDQYIDVPEPHSPLWPVISFHSITSFHIYIFLPITFVWFFVKSPGGYRASMMENFWPAYKLHYKKDEEIAYISTVDIMHHTSLLINSNLPPLPCLHNQYPEQSGSSRMNDLSGRSLHCARMSGDVPSWFISLHPSISSTFSSKSHLFDFLSKAWPGGQRWSLPIFGLPTSCIIRRMKNCIYFYRRYYAPYFFTD